MSRHASEAGFTLIELIVGLSLTALLMAGIFGLLSVSLKSRSSGDRSTELQQTARYATDLMVREIQFAKKIVEVEESSVKFVTDQFTANKTITYTLVQSGGVGKLRRDDGQSQPVTGDGEPINVSVSSLKFSKLRTDISSGEILTVGIEITVADIAAANPRQSAYTLRTAVTGMNIPR